MAQNGCSLGEILLSGEWKSKAFLRYVDDEKMFDKADPLQVLKETLEEDDEEAEEVQLPTVEESIEQFSQQETN